MGMTEKRERSKRTAPVPTLLTLYVNHYVDVLLQMIESYKYVE